MRHANKTPRHAAARAVVAGKDFESAQFRRGLVFPYKSAMLIRRQNHQRGRANKNKTDNQNQYMENGRTGGVGHVEKSIKEKGRLKSNVLVSVI